MSAFLNNLAASTWAAGVSLVALAFVLWPLERLFPARRGQPLFRPRWLTDLAFFAGQYLLWVGLAAVAIRALDARVIDPLIPRGLRAGFATWPLPLQAVVVVMLGDICVYWFHRACHALPLLWRFHAVHHSAEHLDWLAAHREHPVDGLLTQLAVNAPALVLGFSLGQVAWLIALRGMWAIFVHSNGGCRSARCACCWARRSCTTGITCAAGPCELRQPRALDRSPVRHLPQPERPRSVAPRNGSSAAARLPRDARATPLAGGHDCARASRHAERADVH